MQLKLLNQKMQINNPDVKGINVHVDFDYEPQNEGMYIFRLVALVGSENESAEDYRFSLTMEFECQLNAEEMYLSEEELVQALVNEVVQPLTFTIINTEEMIAGDEDIELQEDYEIN